VEVAVVLQEGYEAGGHLLHAAKDLSLAKASFSSRRLVPWIRRPMIPEAPGEENLLKKAAPNILVIINLHPLEAYR
jgi:hypothetical protein